MKKQLFITLSCFVFCLLFSFNVFGLMAGNESDNAYCGGLSGNPCPTSMTITDSIIATGPTIQELIIEGGGFLYQSGSYIDEFFKNIELSEMDCLYVKKMKRILNKAIYSMENARAIYLQLVRTARVTSYNPEVISLLINFDYDSFQSLNNCIEPIFRKVQRFLSVGDVTGIYSEFYSYTGQILDILYLLKRKIDTGQFPNISSVWEVNQKYAEFKLFGQYTAHVFYTLTGQLN